MEANKRLATPPANARREDDIAYGDWDDDLENNRKDREKCFKHNFLIANDFQYHYTTNNKKRDMSR
ncbi:MAG TPA: hypothetical protein DEF21_03840 [Thalassospira lucentensis]|uniref:Uncharacterized protein n=1 Tax=Thalassospira lucentensis TaxID=168935 RepID=A0A358HQI7_9PROT|nr:hypothetical protein [Thalassospira lucentensis]HCW67203.1 hypothetical protein [Thalassospira lucentensis]